MMSHFAEPVFSVLLPLSTALMWHPYHELQHMATLIPACVSLSLFQGAQIPARISIYNKNTSNVRYIWTHWEAGLTATSYLGTQLLTCTMAGKPLGVRDINASVDQDPNSRLTGSGRAMNFTHLSRASAELLWFHAPSNIHCCWSADLRGPGMQPTVGAGWKLLCFWFPRASL